MSTALLAIGVSLVECSESARAIDLFDGRVQLHGSVEEQVRALGRELSSADGIDLAQWYHVLGLELEADLAPGGIGPFAMLQTYVRFDLRYDCVWTRACGLARSVNTHGDRAQRLPRRLSDARAEGHVGAIADGDRRPVLGQPLDQLALGFRDAPLVGHREPGPLWNSAFSILFTTLGSDGVAGTGDDPAFYLFDRFITGDYRFGARTVPGPAVGGVQGEFLGPWLPKNHIDPIGALRDRANPFRGPVDVFGVARSDGGDLHPIFRYPAGHASAGQPIPGDTERPYRRAPDFGFGDASVPDDRARGIYYPTPALVDLVQRDALGSFDSNYRQDELAWNRGASQRTWKEVRELYVDTSLFDDRLFLRLGKQTIVWGKTELLRNTDQMNPQDLGLASLPTLEESRIALWSVRAVYSLYDVGPLEDVRLELAVNLDDFEPADLGRCGEPFAALPLCRKSFGLLAHGITGVGLAGERRPPAAWDDAEGIDLGARVEFRWERFTFQISDYWGYDDFPYPERVFSYERNVDPVSGRPRDAGASGPCRLGTEDACLTAEESLALHSSNQTLFAATCASTIGIVSLDATVCGQSVLTSRNVVTIGGITVQITNAISAILAVHPLAILAKGAYSGLSGVDPATTPGYPDLTGDGLVDTNDLPLVTLSASGGELGGSGLDGVLSREQQALLGCGPIFGTVGCHDSGIDLLNAEATALVQSFPGFGGTEGPGWSTLDASHPQPGTLAFSGGPVCTRFVGGALVVLPGCRGPVRADIATGWVPTIDGVPPDVTLNGVGGDLLAHPFTGQAWGSEMAAVSWNFLTLLVAFSGLGEASDVRAGRIDYFDPARPLAPEKCSYQTPHLCFNVAEFLKLIGAARADVRAGGNERFGRRDFAWHQGGELVLRYDKRNVLGFAADFAEDWTSSTWSIETTWMAGVPFLDADSRDGVSRADAYQLTISVDRPTFIRFLNPGSTFFFNSQWFVQVVDGHGHGFSQNGPANVAATFTVMTGYFQDRLQPAFTGIYDFRSASGGALPQITYRFTEALSLSLGANWFWGRWQAKRAWLNDPGTSVNRTGEHANEQFVENGLAVIRERDELWLRLRWTF